MLLVCSRMLLVCTRVFFSHDRPVGLRSSGMIFQRTTRAVCHIFNLEGYLADVYLDDFYGTDSELYADTAFLRLRELLHEMGLVMSPHKVAPPPPLDQYDLFRYSSRHSVVYFVSAVFPYYRTVSRTSNVAFSSLLPKTPTSIVFYYRLRQIRSHFYVSTVEHSPDFSLQRYTSSRLFGHALRCSVVVRLPSSF